MTHERKGNFFKGPKKSFLIKFFNDQISNYVEPQRKGMPKGQKIGFSINSFAASLMMLTNHTQEHIAKQLNMNVGTLRKWKMKKSFVDMQKKYAEEFIALVHKHAREKCG